MKITIDTEDYANLKSMHKALTREVIFGYINSGRSTKDLQEDLGVSLATCYRHKANLSDSDLNYLKRKEALRKDKVRLKQLEAKIEREEASL